MEKLRILAKPVIYVVALGVLALNVHIPAARAAIVGTDVIVSTQQATQERERVLNLLARDEVKQELLRYGVDPQQTADRVGALSDDEVHQLAAKMDQLPAGGDAIGALVFVFIVLLITDLLGLTDVFPFVKKPVRH